LIVRSKRSTFTSSTILYARNFMSRVGGPEPGLVPGRPVGRRPRRGSRCNPRPAPRHNPRRENQKARSESGASVRTIRPCRNAMPAGRPEQP
jgi:hypothetical protein